MLKEYDSERKCDGITLILTKTDTHTQEPLTENVRCTKSLMIVKV